MIQKKKKNISLICMTYCLGCKNHTNNMASRSVTMTKKSTQRKTKV